MDNINTLLPPELSLGQAAPAPVPPPADKWQREHAAFQSMLPHLLQTHAERYVAIHEGQVVETGDILVDVAMRAYRKFGYIPIYVGKVSQKPRPIERIASPREGR